MKKFISIFLLLYITLPINAQDKTNELSGFIIHKQENGSNGSLDGANIFLIYAKDTLKTTSINGVFRFKPIKTGKAKLIITAGSSPSSAFAWGLTGVDSVSIVPE